MLCSRVLHSFPGQDRFIYFKRINYFMEGGEINGKLLLSPEDFVPSLKSWKIEGVLNPAAHRLPNGKIVLYVRIAESTEQHRHGNMVVSPIMSSRREFKAQYQRRKKKDIIKRGMWGEMYFKDGTCRLPTISHFKRVIVDESGSCVERIRHKPAFAGIPGESDYGVEDPKITKIGNKYYMTYVGVSMNEGVSAYLAFSKNLENWNRLGLIFREQNKDVTLFPEKINRRYVALNRPESTFTFSKPSIWISYSKDLIYWGRDKNLMRPREGTWENSRLGGGTPPIRTSKGWLEIYHGVHKRGGKNVYSAGAVLLDLKNPEKIIARSSPNKPLFEPSELHDKQGYINNVTFPTGVVPTEDGKELLIYSGGADSVITVRKISLEHIFKHLRVKWKGKIKHEN